MVVKTPQGRLCGADNDTGDDEYAGFTYDIS